MKILFFSNETSAKRKLASQIAAHFNPGHLQIYQSHAGFDATDHYTKKVLEEVEIPYSESKVLQSEDATREKYDVIVVLCKCFRTAILSYPGFPSVLHWSLENPIKRGLAPNLMLENLRVLRDDLINRIRHLFQDGYLEVFAHQGSQLHDLFNDFTQGSLKFNRDELITAFNEAAEVITGHREADVLGKPLHFIIPDDMVSRHALAVMDEGVLYRKTHLKMKKANQEIFRVTATYKAIPNSRGQGGLISFEQGEVEQVAQPTEGTRGLERLSWDRVETVLKQTAGNRTKASRILGVGRATFYRFLDREKERGRIPKTELV